MELITLLMAHLLCNEMAAVQTLPKSKVQECTANFERVKIGLNPDLSWQEYQALAPSLQAEVSVKSYQYYVDWKAENAGKYLEMVKEAKMLVNANM